MQKKGAISSILALSLALPLWTVNAPLPQLSYDNGLDSQISAYKTKYGKGG